ncbi:hypothetical protein VCRA2110O182_70127 [Vibrio crassostreae]|nr:hypothetical protein VCRA2110O182_70127 [Vibrio crassostreae]CAK2375618.1 hypothetical protein VCRA211O406_70090 [Vibrio crassostreae]
MPLFEFGRDPGLRRHTTTATKWQRMLLSWVVFRGLNFAVALNQLPVLVTPVRKTEQFLGIEFAIFRGNEDRSVNVDSKSVPTMIQGQVTTGVNVHQFFGQWIDRYRARQPTLDRDRLHVKIRGGFMNVVEVAIQQIGKARREHVISFKLSNIRRIIFSMTKHDVHR